MTINPVDIVVLSGFLLVSVVIIYLRIKHPTTKRMTPHERCEEYNRSLNIKKYIIKDD